MKAEETDFVKWVRELATWCERHPRLEVTDWSALAVLFPGHYQPGAEFEVLTQDAAANRKLAGAVVHYSAAGAGKPSRRARMVAVVYAKGAKLRTAVVQQCARKFCADGLCLTHRSLGLGVGAELIARVPVVQPELLWVRAARFLELEDLVVLGDQLTQREDAASSRVRLTRAVARAEKWPGVVRARQALEWVAERTDSAMESLVRLRLVWPRRLGGYGLRAQPSVNARIALGAAERAALGRQYLLADMLWPKARVIVEYDGEAAHFAGDSTRWAYDVQRETVLREKGYRVFRVSKTSFYERRIFDTVARQIFRAVGCRFRGAKF
jgi:hypothetical protein